MTETISYHSSVLEITYVLQTVFCLGKLKENNRTMLQHFKEMLFSLNFEFTMYNHNMYSLIMILFEAMFEATL